MEVSKRSPRNLKGEGSDQSACLIGAESNSIRVALIFDRKRIVSCKTFVCSPLVQAIKGVEGRLLWTLICTQKDTVEKSERERESGFDGERDSV